MGLGLSNKENTFVLRQFLHFATCHVQAVMHVPLLCEAHGSLKPAVSLEKE